MIHFKINSSTSFHKRQYIYAISVCNIIMTSISRVLWRRKAAVNSWKSVQTKANVCHTTLCSSCPAIMAGDCGVSCRLLMRKKNTFATQSLPNQEKKEGDDDYREESCLYTHAHIFLVFLFLDTVCDCSQCVYVLFSTSVLIDDLLYINPREAVKKFTKIFFSKPAIQLLRSAVNLVIEPLLMLKASVS